MTIYLDMDGVVADFSKYARTIISSPCDEYTIKYPEHEWKKLAQNDRLYRDLELKDGANELVDWCTNYCERTKTGLFFLTAIPTDNDMPWAFYDKVMWGQKYFNHIPVFFGPRSRDKSNFCKKGDVLIDDRPINIDQWKLAGGKGHTYTTWDKCKIWLDANLTD